MIEQRFLATPHFSAKPGGRLFLREEFDTAQTIIQSIAGYEPTPLRDVTGLASGPRKIWYKDEANRFDNGSFKPLGAVVALAKAIEKHGRDLVVTAATAGNYGRALAWAAAQHNLRCVIFVHAAVSDATMAAIARYGAEVRRVPGEYEDAVDTAIREAAANGWLVVADTSADEDDELSRWVMIGYSTMLAEIERQTDERPDLILVQGGVGGLAAALAGWFEIDGATKPQIYVFEPAGAACLIESASHDQLHDAQGELNTELLPLACRRPSAVAWPVLARNAAGFLTISDESAHAGMRTLHGLGIEAGPCAGAALGALEVLARHVDLNGRTLLLIGTEGMTRISA